MQIIPEVVVIEIENGAVYCTPDHPVWSELLKRYLPARRYEIVARRKGVMS